MAAGSLRSADAHLSSIQREPIPWPPFEDVAAAIAHQLPTLAPMDRLIVPDRGRIVEQGLPAEQLRLGGHDGSPCAAGPRSVPPAIEWTPDHNCSLRAFPPLTRKRHSHGLPCGVGLTLLTKSTSAAITALDAIPRAQHPGLLGAAERVERLRCDAESLVQA
jgi:hypothetical protein